MLLPWYNMHVYFMFSFFVFLLVLSSLFSNMTQYLRRYPLSRLIFALVLRILFIFILVSECLLQYAHYFILSSSVSLVSTCVIFISSSLCLWHNCVMESTLHQQRPSYNIQLPINLLSEAYILQLFAYTPSLLPRTCMLDDPASRLRPAVAKHEVPHSIFINRYSTNQFPASSLYPIDCSVLKAGAFILLEAEVWSFHLQTPRHILFLPFFAVSSFLSCHLLFVHTCFALCPVLIITSATPPLVFL